MAATSLLASALNQRGIPLRSLQSLSAIQGKDQNFSEWKFGQSLVQLAGINEAMAIWWEENLLSAMEFEMGDYLALKKKNNPYVAQLERLPQIEVLEYISQWENLRYYREPTTKNFLGSFSKIVIDKWSFLG